MFQNAKTWCACAIAILFVAPRIARSDDLKKCEAFWDDTDRSATEANPFAQNGFARTLSHEVDFGDTIASVEASAYESYSITYRPNQRTGQAKVVTCNYPVGWTVRLARPRVDFAPLLAFNNETSRRQARNGVIFVARNWRANESVNAIVAWTLQSTEPSQEELDIVRSRLAIPSTHDIVGEKRSANVGNRGVAIKFSADADPRSGPHIWSVYSPGSYPESGAGFSDNAFLPETAKNAFGTLAEAVEHAPFCSLQTMTAWDAQRQGRACEAFDNDTIASTRCSLEQPRAVNQLFENAERAQTDLYAHVVWRTADEKFALTSLRLSPGGAVAPELTEAIPDPSGLGLPEWAATQVLEWP